MKHLKIVLFLGLSLVVTGVALANMADIAWTPPSQYEDGTPLSVSGIKSFKIYYGSKQGGPYQFIATVSGSSTNVTINDLPNGTWYFVATTLSTDDVESQPTPEVSKVINVVKRPRPPQNFVVK